MPWTGRVGCRARPQIGRERLGYVAQTFFLDELGDLEKSLAVVRAMRGRWSERLANFERLEAEILALAGSPDNLPAPEFHRYAALRMGLHQIRAKLAWCDETIGRLQSRVGERAPAIAEQ